MISAQVFLTQMKDREMKRGHLIRIIAGSSVLVSLALGTWVNHTWYWFTAFVGANLFQSGFTKWCLMEDILRKLGLGKEPAISSPQRG